MPNARPKTPDPSVAAFDKLLHAYYETSFARLPTWGSSVGRHEFDADMGRATPETWRKHGALAAKTLAAVENLPAQDFGPVENLDRRAFVANLRQTVLDNQTLNRWRNNPQIHLQTAAESVFDHLVKHAENLAPVAPAILSRLKKIPRYLDEAAECIDRPDPLWQRLTLKAAPGVEDLFTSLVDPLAAATNRPRPGIERIARDAAAAARAYAKHVGKLKPAPEGSYALGTDRFTALLRERTALPCSPGEAAAMARRWADELGAALAKEARRFHPKKPAHEILAGAAAQWSPPGDSLLSAYQSMTDRLKARFIESGWMSFPKGDRLLVRPVPAFMRDQFPTAAYSAPGAEDPDQTGVFWVNDLTLQQKNEKRRRAEQSQHFGMELTAAHEAYPGHHLQYVHQNRIPTMARRMAHHAIYYEGWTLWCEQMTADLMGGDKDLPYMRLKQLHDALWRAWRIVIDAGLHTGQLTCDSAAKILIREVGFTKGRAEGDLNWYTAAPTVPMSYLFGKMEVMRLKRARVDLGAWPLRKFNDWALAFGAIPWRWIEESGL